MPLGKLNDSNPTRHGLAPALVPGTYTADPRGPRPAREALASFLTELHRGAEGAGTAPAADPNRLYLLSSTSQAYSWLMKLLCDAGDAVLAPKPGYPLIESIARLECVDTIEYQLRFDGSWYIDVAELRALLDGPQGARIRALVLINPNNPTGSLITQDKLKTILTHCKETNTYVMIDETYIEFVPDVDELSAIPLTELFDNVIILRGTSKFFATPGLRLGYAITSNSQILTDINTYKNPWMINSLAVVAGETMFLDEEYIDKTRSLILSEKTRCRQLIEESHKFKLYPSYSNFYLLKILDEGVDAHMLFERAIRQGMMIRDCSTFPGLEERFIRFCIMKPEDNTRLINCLTQ